MDVNLGGAFHCMRACLPGMIGRRYGRVVNIASIAGKDGNPNMAAYSASKAGVIALTRARGLLTQALQRALVHPQLERVDPEASECLGEAVDRGLLL